MERLQAAPNLGDQSTPDPTLRCLSVQRAGARQPVKNRTGCACFQWLGPGMKCGVNSQRSGAENLNSGVFNQQPSTHTALWTADGLAALPSAARVQQRPRSPYRISM